MATENLEIGPFYENQGDDTYVCDLTGRVCGCVTKHFQDYRAFIRDLSERGDDRIFLTSEPNLCTQMGCSVYENEWIRLVELRTQVVKQKILLHKLKAQEDEVKRRQALWRKKQSLLLDILLLHDSLMNVKGK